MMRLSFPAGTLRRVRWVTPQRVSMPVSTIHDPRKEAMPRANTRYRALIRDPSRTARGRCRSEREKNEPFLSLSWYPFEELLRFAVLRSGDTTIQLGTHR